MSDYSNATEKGENQIEEKIWNEYLQSGDVNRRAELIGRYLPYLKGIARTIFFQVRAPELDLEDCIHFGMVGLLESMNRYNPERKINFQTFAYRRIRGAILDGIRKFSERLDRQSLRKTNLEKRTESIVESRALETGREVFFDTILEVTIDLAITCLLERAGKQDTKTYQDTPYDQMENSILVKQLFQLVENLRQTEKTIIVYHYFFDLSFTAIAESLGISKTRVSQIHAKVIADLRNKLELTPELEKLI